MKLSKLFFIVLMAQGLTLRAQPPTTETYFCPIRPNERVFLAGSMSEMRSSHFHAGIDIKTSGREGLKVYATATGYISRIKIAPDGYGNSLYIEHLDGNTSVYAHLLSLHEPLATYVRQKQYELKSFDVDLFPDKDLFPVSRGQPIALSGNSGSSGGPHLHFEIRDKNQNILNPLKFGFKEIQDDIPPIAQSLGIRPINIDSRINAQYKRQEFNVVRRGTNYYIDKPIEVWGKVGLELLAHDKLSGAANKNGIPCIEVKLNSKRVFYQNIQQMSFNDQRNILVHTNYAVTMQTGRRFAKLYKDDGNELKFYEDSAGTGYLQIYDTLLHNVVVNMWDPYGNISSLHFLIKGNKGKEFLTKQNNGNRIDQSRYYVDNNTLVCISEWAGPNPQQAVFYVSGSKYEVKPAYNVGTEAHFLWDLRYGIPDSVDLCSSKEKVDLEIMVPSGREMTYFDPKMEVKFHTGSLFDTLYLHSSHKIKENEQWEVFTFGNELTPLRRDVSLKLMPDLVYPNKAKTHIYNTDDLGNFNFLGGKWNENTISANTRNLGSYTILTDTIPPKINVIRLNKDLLSFVLDDALSGIGKFELTVAGEWVLMNYDKKRRLIWSEKLDNSKPFSGEMQLKVWDNAGNELLYKYNL